MDANSAFYEIQRFFDYLEEAGGDIAIPNTNLMGNVVLASDVNSNDNINFGSVNTATIQLQLADLKYPLSTYKGRNFKYYKAYAGKPVRNKCPYSNAEIVAQNGLWYAYTRAGTLYYGSDTISRRSVAITEGAGCLIIRNSTLTVLYDTAPYAIQFPITDGILGNPVTPALDAYDAGIAKRFARRKFGYNSAQGVFTEFVTIPIIDDLFLETTEFEVFLKGVFTADKPSKSTGGVYNLTCYDNMSLLTADMSDVVQTITSSTTAGQLLERICAKANVPLAAQVRLNEKMAISKPEGTYAIGGDQLLTWLGEIMGCSWRISSAGELFSVWYTESDVIIRPDAYKSFLNEEINVAQIDKVIVQSVYAEVAGTAGTGSNDVTFANNGLIPYTTAAQLNSFAATILTVAQEVKPYNPAKLTTYCNPYIFPGQSLTVQTDDGEFVSIYTMSMIETGFSLEVSSYGEEYRNQAAYTGSGISVLNEAMTRIEQMLISKINVLTGKLGGSKIEIADPLTGKPYGTAYLLDTYDIKTAKELIVLDRLGIGYYNNGYNVNNPAGNTPTMVLTDRQGRINASAIKLGAIASVLGNTSLDLATGDFIFKGKACEWLYNETLGKYILVGG